MSEEKSDGHLRFRTELNAPPEQPKPDEIFTSPEQLIGHVVKLATTLTDEQVRDLILRLQKVLCNR